MKTLLSISLLAVGLAGCSKASPDYGVDYATQEELDAQIAKCEGLNGTLRGERQTRGEHMGEWFNLYCDFETPPAPKEPETDTTTESW